MSKAVIVALKITPGKPARQAPASHAPVVVTYRVEVLGSVREIDWTQSPLAQRFEHVGQGRKSWSVY